MSSTDPAVLHTKSSSNLRKAGVLEPKLKPWPLSSNASYEGEPRKLVVSASLSYGVGILRVEQVC